MTIEQAAINIEKELKCRKEEINCENTICMDCPFHVSYENLTDTLQTLYDWIKILKKAKFEYDEAWRIITHPTPDVNYADKQRAQVILDTFRGSLGKMDERRTDGRHD